MKVKRYAVLTAAVVLAGAAALALSSYKSASVGIIGGADGPTAIYVADSPSREQELYASRIKYIGDASGVGKILSLMEDIDGCTPDGMELKTDSAPYKVVRRLSGTPADISQMEKQAALMLSLIENANYVVYQFDTYAYGYGRDYIENKYNIKLSGQTLSEEAFAEFYKLVYARRDTLDEAVSKAIISGGMGNYMDGECRAEGHILLGSEEQDSKTVAYVMSTYGEYRFENNTFVKISGTGVIPVRISFARDENGGYVLDKYDVPLDGSYYASSVKEMFPAKYHSRALSYSDSDYKICKEQEYVYAERYLNAIGRSAEISSNIERDTGGIDFVKNEELSKQYSDYPYWIGTLEKIEDGERYVYERKWEPEGTSSSGTLTFLKYSYDDNKTVSKNEFKLTNGIIAQ